MRIHFVPLNQEADDVHAKMVAMNTGCDAFAGFTALEAEDCVPEIDCLNAVTLWYRLNNESEQMLYQELT